MTTSVSPRLLAARFDPELSADARSVLAQVDHACGREFRDWVVARLQAVSVRLADPDVTVAFCGRFSSGKSTLLNALLGRDLLPTSSYAETGARCRIVGGARESVLVRRRDGSARTVACTTRDIAAAITLTGESGEIRSEVRDIAELVVTVAASTPPAGTAWIDSPGTDDGTGGDDANSGLDDADVVVWVTRSDSVLGLSETTALAERVASHGPEGCLLAVNMILDVDSPERFAELVGGRIGAGIRQRAVDSEDRIGTDIGPLRFLAARAALTVGSGFGLEGLREILIDREELRRRAHAARLHLARRELAAVRSHIDAEIGRLDGEVRRGRVAAEQLRERRNDDDERFTAALRSEVDALIAAHRLKLGEAATTAAEELATDAAVDGKDCARTLTSTYTATVAAMATKLSRRAAAIAQQHRRSSPPGALVADLRQHLLPSEPAITGSVAAVMPGGVASGAGGAIIGAITGSFILMPWLGAAAGAAIGGAAGKSETDGRRAALDALRQEIRAAGTSAADELAGRADGLVAILLERCPPGTAPPPLPDDRGLLALIALRDRVLTPLAGLVANPATAVDGTLASTSS